MPTLLLLLCCALGPAEAQNLVSNPSFEGASGHPLWPAGWTQLDGEPIELRGKGGHIGQRYVHFFDSKPDQGSALESRHVPAVPGATYRMQAFVRTHYECQPGIYIQFHDARGTRVSEVHELFPGPWDGWMPFEVRAVAPPEAVEVSALLYAFVGDVGDFDFDDVELVLESWPTGRGGDPAPAYATWRQLESAAAGWSARSTAMPGGKPMVDIGSRLELFVDSFMVDGLAGSAERRLHHPVPREAVLYFDKPWEGASSAYVTVMQDADRIRLYYRGSDLKDTHQVTCYAESRDGVHFERPNLGLFEFGGSKDNNIIWTATGVHNFAPFLDTNPNCPPDQRYKAVAGGGLIALVSADGVRWRKLVEEPVITEGAFDSQNLAFYDNLRGEYVCFLRDFANGVRAIRRATSKDFVNWTTPEWLDFGSAPAEHLYTNATVPYFRAPHIYLAFPKRFMPERTKDPSHGDPGVSDGVLMSSRDGLLWERWVEGFLRPGPDPKNWTQRSNMICWGLIPSSEQEISIYWSEHYCHDSAHLRRGTIRTDGFVSAHAGVPGGEVLTRPFTFTGKSLSVNYATSGAGSARFELCDGAGKPLEGFSLADSEVLFGDEIAHTVSWRGGNDVGTLAGRPVRLRVRLEDADLYSFRFAP